MSIQAALTFLLQQFAATTHSPQLQTMAKDFQQKIDAIGPTIDEVIAAVANPASIAAIHAAVAKPSAGSIEAAVEAVATAASPAIGAAVTGAVTTAEAVVKKPSASDIAEATKATAPVVAAAEAKVGAPAVVQNVTKLAGAAAPEAAKLVEKIPANIDAIIRDAEQHEQHPKA